MLSRLVVTDVNARMAKLARTFPCMKGNPGVMSNLPPWNAIAVDAWGASGQSSHGERVTAQFLLAVWSPQDSWECGKFDLMEALRVWDESHHRAFLVWASNPWWA